jgi:hypothetical protein
MTGIADTAFRTLRSTPTDSTAKVVALASGVAGIGRAFRVRAVTPPTTRWVR